MSATLIHGKTSGGGTHLPVKVEAYGDGTGVLVTQTQVRLDTTVAGFGVSFAPGATATDVLVLHGDTSSYVRRIIVSGTATAAASTTIKLIRRSTANSGGTTSTLTASLYGSAGVLAPDTAGTIYTAAPAGLGTEVGIIAQQILQVSSAAAGVGVVPVVFDYRETPIYVAELAFLTLNLNGVTIAGLTLNVTVEFERAT
jgi:hypothetical protein